MKRRFTTLSEILRGSWLMNLQAAQSYFPTVKNMMDGVNPKSYWDDNDADNTPADHSETNGEFEVILLGNDGVKSLAAYRISELGLDSPPEKAPKNSVAIISFTDVLTKYDQWCGGAGAVTKRNLLERCMSNPNIKAVVFEIDGPGGDGNATELLYDAARNSNKPVVSFVEGMAASAHLWVAVGTDKIVMAGGTSQIGSLGSYVQLVDFTEYYKKEGIEVRRIYAPQSTEKNAEYEQALAGNDEPMKASLKKHVDFFTKAVKEGRPNLKNDAKIFAGAMFFTEEAINLGLADQKGTLNDAIELAYNLASDPEFIKSKNKKTNTSMALFGNKYPSISSLKDVEAPTEAQIESANAELVAAGINGATLVSNAELLEIETELASGVTAKADLSASNQKVSTLQEQVNTLTAKVTELGGKPGDVKTSVTAGADKIEDAGDSSVKKFEEYPHNKQALELANQFS